MRRIVSVFIALVICGAVATTASAQNRPSANGASPTVFLSFNAGFQPSSTFNEPVASAVYLEPLAIDSAYSIPSGVLFDGGAGVRLTRALGVGVAISSFRKNASADIDASIPHPFSYGHPRSATGSSSARRSELAAHLQVLVFAPLPRRAGLTVSVGPSWFSASQDVVTGITFTESYLYDTATFGAATPTRVSKKGAGFNVGADVRIPLAQHVGVGAMVRYAHAAMDFSVSSATGNVRSDVGGLQAGGGVRLFF